MQRKLRKDYKPPRRGIGNVSKVVLTSLIMLLAVMVFAQAGTSARTCVDLGALNGTVTYAMEINEDGDIMGQAGTDANTYRGFYWDRDSGRLTDIGVLPGYQFTRPADMNSKGVIAATSAGPGMQGAFVWDPRLASPMLKLADLNDGLSSVVGITDFNYAVGNSYVNGSSHACMWWGINYGTLADLGTLGGAESIAKGIASGNRVFGESDSNATYGGIRHAFWRPYVHHAHLIDIGAFLPDPYNMSSCAEHMAGGYIVGSVYEGAVRVGSFYYEGSLMLYLQDIYIADVNDDGWIVGNDYTGIGQGRPFVWADPYGGSIAYLDCGPNDVGFSAFPEDINYMCQIVGYAIYNVGQRACVWEPLWDPANSYDCIDLGALQGATVPTSQAVSINEGGQVAGSSNCAGGEVHAVLWRENAPPVAVFTFEWVGELTVRLDASASFDSDGMITGYTWDFGDGSPTATGMIATHTYAAPGSYIVTLTVADDYGGSASTSQSLDGADVPLQEITELIVEVDTSPYITYEAKKELTKKLAVAKRLIEARKVHGDPSDVEARKVHGESIANVLQVFDEMLVEYTVLKEITDPKEGWRLTMDANLITVLLANKVLIQGLPCYKWYNGCGPTAAGMIIGYWDGHGFSDLVKYTDDAMTQSSWVNAMIASPEHISDYALYPENPNDPYSRTDDSSGDIIPDKSTLGGAHQDNCLADFMGTSRSQQGFRYGQSYTTSVPKALEDYTSYANSQYVGLARQVPAGALKWKDLKYQVDAGHPMALTVDIDGDRATDHLVTVVGYCEIGCANMYAFYSTWDCSIWFANFVPMDVDVYFGVWSGFTFDISWAPA